MGELGFPRFFSRGAVTMSTAKAVERDLVSSRGWGAARAAETGSETGLDRPDRSVEHDRPRQEVVDLENLVRRQLAALGEDPAREGLQRTPERVASSLAWLTRGYSLRVEDVIGDALFEEAHESMVMVRDIELYSLCEHHMLPFFGKAHIAYIPDGKIVGLSKLPRIVDMFARRLQVQERLTKQVAAAIEDVLKPRGVGVVIEAVHLCMMMRGVEKQNSRTLTSALRGEFRTCPMTRNEFLGLAHRP